MSEVENVISYFKKVCSIPRASGDEKAVCDYIVDFAKKRNLSVARDLNHNLIIRKPATAPSAGGPVILQGHLDMVYVKEEGSTHVYTDGIEVKEDDEYYFAKGTSLGADNGIAIAYCLALLDSNEIVHPDLEVIFTVKEEVGLIGADVIDISTLKGMRLINLDSEEEGIFYTSCAGGLRCRMIWNIDEKVRKEAAVSLKVTVKGLTGGHSGMNIGMGLGNSIVLLGRILYSLRDLPVHINELDVQGKANAIANSGSVCLYVRPGKLEAVKQVLKEAEKTFRSELQYTDTVSLEIEEGELTDSAKVYSDECQRALCHSLMLLPYGVAGRSFAIEGLIETSMNLGSLTREGGKLTLLMSLRSSVASQKYFLRDKIQIIAQEYCDSCIFESDYPGWQYRKDSPLRDTAISVYERLFHKKAEAAAIHAGLECGYWDSKRPGLDIISIGPDLYDVHSVNERASKESIAHMWKYLKELLREL